MANTILDWDSGAGHVDESVLQGPSSRDYIGAESVVIAAGPPALDNVAWDQLKPIGVLQNFGVQQSRQLQQLFEIGSKESYFIPGKTFVNAQFSRVLIHGPNLLKAFYQYYDGTTAAKKLFSDGNEPKFDLPGVGSSPTSYYDAHFYINLASEVFAKPIGLLLYMQDSDKEDYSASYLENCFIQSHQMSVSAQQTLIMENVQVRASKLISLASITNTNNVIL